MPEKTLNENRSQATELIKSIKANKVACEVNKIAYEGNKVA
jgi:hypothetical protein